MNIIRIAVMAVAASAVCLGGCKTEINNPPPREETTVVHDQPAVVDQGQPAKVENNIKVDH